MTIHQTLEKYFGHKEFRPGQEEIINAIISGKNVLGILPTGAGKSICYQVPAISSENFSIVISPLIALMKDQVDSLNSIERTAAFINSSLDYSEVEKVLNDLANNKIQLLYLSPEKLENRLFTERLKKLNPKFLFIDEAHCISEWGHNFRPSYRRIKDFKNFMEFENIAAFTATATPEVRKDIIEQLNLTDPVLFVKGFERDNLELNVIKGKQKNESLLKIVKSNQLPAIIYTSTRRNAENASEYLRRHGINSQYYHAGISNEMRRIIQDDFSKDRIPVIAATNAFGMGIDKKDIRLIVHYNLPSSIENYYQEIGRAGRDGKLSKVYLLYDEKDKNIHKFLINSSYPSREQIEIVYQSICDYGKVAFGSTSDKPISLENELIIHLKTRDINSSLLNSSLRILEESGYIKHESGYNSGYFIQFLVSPNQLKKYSSNLGNEIVVDILLILLREFGSTAFEQKLKIDIEKIAGTLGIYHNSVNNELEYLSSRGLIEFDKPTASAGVHIITPRVKKENLRIKMIDLLRQKSHAENRLEEMINYAFSKECRFRFMQKYFGEEASSYSCGKCDICTGSEEDHSINEFIESKILELLSEAESSLSTNKIVEILTGDSEEAESIFYTPFASCSHFSSKQIKQCLKELQQSGRIIKNDENKYELFELEFKLDLESRPEESSEYEPYLKLFNTLRQIRQEVSQKFGQAPKLICPDDVLKSIAKKRPATVSELLSVKGFTQRMYHKFGEDILSSIKENKIEFDENKILDTKKVPDNIKQIFELVKKRYSLKDISKLTKLPEAVVSMQIESLIILFPELIIDSLIDYKKSMKIKDAIQSGITNLKELKQNLGNQISYAEIRIILAKESIKTSSHLK